MATIQTFEDLQVWQKSRCLCKEIYSLTLGGDFARDYALKDQINRSSGSIMDNIAEGFGRQSSKEFVGFLTIAGGSALEVKSQLYRALDRHYISSEVFQNLIDRITEIYKMLSGLIGYLNKTDIRGFKFKNRT